MIGLEDNDTSREFRMSSGSGQQKSAFPAFKTICLSQGPLYVAAMAKPVELKLRVGDKAPDFRAQASGGKEVKLSDLRGKNVILYFYPKDDTPGCTKEACGFRDDFAKFEEKGAVILGVSVDPLKAHDKFISKFQAALYAPVRSGEANCPSLRRLGRKDVHGTEVSRHAPGDLFDRTRRPN